MEYKGFDEKTYQELKSYVYFLRDPMEKKPFYIGKGGGKGEGSARVFAHVEEAAKNPKRHTRKLDKIREIHGRADKKYNAVEHIIVRHGLKEHEAFEIEAALIDFCGNCGIPLTNEQSGHDPLGNGLMTIGEIRGRYEAVPLKEMGDDCIIININKSYKRGFGSDRIYEATRKYWIPRQLSRKRIADKKAKGEVVTEKDIKLLEPSIDKDIVHLTILEKVIGTNIKAKYVLSDYRKLIVEVFEVKRWLLLELKTQKGKEKAWCFEGIIAPPKIRDKYIHKSIEKLQGAMRPIISNPHNVNIIHGEQP
jgi:hypothetical protein